MKLYRKWKKGYNLPPYFTPFFDFLLFVSMLKTGKNDRKMIKNGLFRPFFAFGNRVMRERIRRFKSSSLRQNKRDSAILPNPFLFAYLKKFLILPPFTTPKCIAFSRARPPTKRNGAIVSPLHAILPYSLTATLLTHPE